MNTDVPSRTTARPAAGIAAHLVSAGLAALLAGLTFLDPAKAGSVPRSLAHTSALWWPMDRVLVALAWSTLAGGVVLALTALGDRDARLHLGKHAVCDGGFTVVVFALAPWALLRLGGHLDPWARPGMVVVGVAMTLVVVGLGLIASRRPASVPAAEELGDCTAVDQKSWFHTAIVIRGTVSGTRLRSWPRTSTSGG